VDDGRLRVTDAEPLRRRRLAVLFRALLAIPHYIVLSVWSLLVLPVLAWSWVAAVLLGRVPRRGHRVLAAYLRYQGQVTAWFYLLSGRYPDPLHTRDHPFRIDVPEPRDQHRVVTFLRVPLAVPAIVLASVFNVILSVVVVGSWFVALLRGRTTAGMQELGTFCVRYQLETQAYVSLLTARYPRLAPAAATEPP
jgi:hypothetical protein